MDNVRELALSALYQAVRAAVGGIATVERHGIETVPIPPGGLVTVRDGTPGEPETYMGDLVRYGYEHRAEIVVQVQHQRDASRDAALSGLLSAIHAALSADPTLGGAVEDCTPEEPEMQTDRVEGGPAIKGAMFPVVLSYVSTRRI